MLPSLSPTNLSVVPLPGVGVEVRATFHDANTSDGTYARFEVSTDNTFATTDYDSGQVAITPITDGAEGIMVFAFIPLVIGTYFCRLCFWDDINYTKTAWLVWNGTVVTTSALTTITRRPNADSAPLQLTPVPGGNHFSTVDEDPADDADYVYNNSGGSWFIDKYTVPTSGINPDTLKNIQDVTVYGRFNDDGRIYCNSGYYEFVIGAGFQLLSYTWATNPDTTLAWTLANVNSLLVGAGIYTRDYKCSQLYAEIRYYYYIFTFTPPGNNSLTIGFPSITSFNVSNDKDKYTFTAIISDTYTRPPIVALTVGNDTEVMDYISRTGSGPYSYTFSKTIQLERGDYEYHIEVGNVWTVVIDSIRFLHTNYNLDEEPKIEVFIGDRKINTWNHLLTENILPDFSEIEFDTDENIKTYNLTVKFIKNDFKQYSMSIQSKSKISEGYHVRVKESAKDDLEQVVSFSLQAINSLSLLESLLPNYIFSGELIETIYLQTFLNERLIDILKRVLILNNAIGYVRNKKIYLYDLSNTDALFKMNVLDPQIGYESDLTAIVNKVREYYIRKMYPVPENVFTNYDHLNWTGTATDVRQTANGILPPSGSLYCLKGVGTIYRTIDFLWSDFDQLNINWSPDVATTLEIRLETDAANYRKYTRTFSGLEGAGFVLTGTLPTDTIIKTITFANKYIHTIQGSVTQPCSFKVELKLSGAVVATQDWQSSTGLFGAIFNNVLCDTISISFTNLYPIGTSYGINCSNLLIEEYEQTYQQTGVSQTSNWSNRYTGTIKLNWTNVGLNWTGTATKTFGNAPPLAADESYNFIVHKCSAYAFKMYPPPYPGESFDLIADLNVIINANGIIEATFNASFAQDNVSQVFAIPSFSYDFEVFRLTIVPTGQWVWTYINYQWDTTYNLWDSLSIPFSQFTTIGSPTNQINTIRLMAATDNYYDTICFVKNNPIPQYIEAENTESSAKGIKFQERKLDGWSSKESALAFATAFVDLFGDAAESYSKQMSMKTDINIGDMVDCDGTILPVYKIVYDLNAGQMTVFVGRSVTDTLEWLKETSRKIDAIEKVIY